MLKQPAGFGVWANAPVVADEILSERDRVSRGDDSDLAAEAAGYSDEELPHGALTPVASDVGHGGPQ